MGQVRTPVGATVRCMDCRQLWIVPGPRRVETRPSQTGVSPPDDEVMDYTAPIYRRV
ncbi:MAG TPA: hypothetical protein VFS10_18985 [Pyrinomonadaceae bacterium]|nr:hypothetical protein [Pyrinomonadaceae bacterium]